MTMAGPVLVLRFSNDINPFEKNIPATSDGVFQLKVRVYFIAASCGELDPIRLK